MNLILFLNTRSFKHTICIICKLFNELSQYWKQFQLQQIVQPSKYLQQIQLYNAVSKLLTTLGTNSGFADFGMQGAYGQPQGGFGQPQGGFGQPQGGFGQPQGGFGQPQGGFGQPQGGFGQPQGGFGQQQGGFGQQQQGSFGTQGAFNNQPQAGFSQPQNIQNNYSNQPPNQPNNQIYGNPPTAGFGQTNGTPNPYSCLNQGPQIMASQSMKVPQQYQTPQQPQVQPVIPPQQPIGQQTNNYNNQGLDDLEARLRNLDKGL
ncbi:unnamed protein product [Paramecium sonneborni]|uniref:Uncharacterized protein n=1 Tax=Paramecium sonneborni TaxID=65129 RepID=A0A8S1LD59_9CILI|nr:unnamed protein product [Paramecium sonneborni]